MKNDLFFRAASSFVGSCSCATMHTFFTWSGAPRPGCTHFYVFWFSRGKINVFLRALAFVGGEPRPSQELCSSRKKILSISKIQQWGYHKNCYIPYCCKILINSKSTSNMFTCQSDDLEIKTADQLSGWPLGLDSCDQRSLSDEMGFESPRISPKVLATFCTLKIFTRNSIVQSVYENSYIEMKYMDAHVR